MNEKDPGFQKIANSVKAALVAYALLRLLAIAGALLAMHWPTDPHFPWIYPDTAVLYVMLVSVLLALLPRMHWPIASIISVTWTVWFALPSASIWSLDDLPRLLSVLLLCGIPLFAFRKPTGSAEPRFGYIPTLDGWRAIAIIAVVVDHSMLGRWGGDAGRIGQNGVNLFFVISGYLISSKLLIEKDIEGHISLEGFYRRRIFRILPPAIPVIAVIGLIGCLGWVRVTGAEIGASALYFRNFLQNDPTPISGHFWSLAIEEQFYLVVPLMILLLRRRTMLALSVGGALACGIWRWAYFSVHPYNALHFADRLRTDFRVDGLLLGCALAVVMQNPEWRERIRRALSTPVWCAGVALIVWVIARNPGVTTLRESALWTLLMIGTVLNSRSVAGRILESKPLRLIGRLSYSLYLWQQLFLFTFGDRHLDWMSRFPLNLVLLAAVAAASHYGLERPVLRWARNTDKKVSIRRPVATAVAV